MKLTVRVLVVAALAVSATVLLAPPAESGTTFKVGIPTIVDPVRGAGEPDIAVDNGGNALITGPGGSYVDSPKGGLDGFHDHVF